MYHTRERESDMARASRLLQNVEKVKPLFRYPDLETEAEYADNSMFGLTLFQLWVERKAREAHVPKTRQASR